MIADRLREAVVTGRELDLGAEADYDEQQWDRSDWERQPARCVSAELIADLVTGQDQVLTRPPRALILSGARITGRLTFDWSEIKCVIAFSRCLFDEPLTALHSRMSVLQLNGCRLSSLNISGLSADSVDVTASNFEGPMIAQEIHIFDSLALDGAIFNSDDEPALIASGAHVDQNLTCRGLEACGGLHLDGAVIGGSFTLSGTRLTGTDNDPAGVHADRIFVGGTLFLRDNFEAKGLFSCLGANINGNIEMDGAQLREGLLAADMRVGGSLFLRNGFSSQGPIVLSGCNIRGDLDMHDARLLGIDSEGVSLAAAELEARRIYAPALEARGTIWLFHARIVGDLEMDGAQLSGYNGVSLLADRLRAGGSVNLRNRFQAEGRVRLLGAEVTGHLDICDSSIPFLNLADASAQTLVDSDERSWPKKLEMTGFEYKRIEPAEPGSAQERLRWLKRQAGGYVPHIYFQLASMYSSKGQDADARRVRLADQRIRRRAQGRLKTIIGWIPDALVGFGYRPWRAVGWGLLLLGVGTPIFAHEHSVQNLIPTAAHGTAAEFHPALYTLNLLLPVVNLGQSNPWLSRGAATWLAAGWTIAGWVLATVVVAGLAGVFRKG